MKNKEEIKKEIFELVKKLSPGSSDQSIFEIARDLYERSILLKHAANSAPQAIIENAEKIVETLQEPVKPELPEQKQATIDLFSTDTPAPTAPAAPVAEPTAPKEQKAPKKKAAGSVADKLQHRKITDLKSAIGINEKFQFINELFEGNMKEYSVAVDQINSFSTYDEAESYTLNLEDVYKWQPENPIVENFKGLVQRRFA